KILRLHKELATDQLVEIVSTFLGAHVVPAEFRGKGGGAERYIQLMEQNMLPEIGESRLAEFCDVFCDCGAFSVEQSKRVLQAGRQWGLVPRLHAEQLSRTCAWVRQRRLGWRQSMARMRCGGANPSDRWRLANRRT